MSRFDSEAPTKRVKMVPGPRHGFTRDETSSITVDSEAIVEVRNARPPAAPRTSASFDESSRQLAKTRVAVPKAGIIRVSKPRLNRH